MTSLLHLRLVALLAILAGAMPMRAQLAERDSAYEKRTAQAEEWLLHAMELHPQLADDRAALLQAMGATPATYRNLAFIEGTRGNREQSLDYLRISSEMEPGNADAAIDYLLAVRSVDTTKYRNLAEAIPIRFPLTEQAAEATYWLAIDTPLIEEKIALLEKCRLARPASFTTLKFQWWQTAMELLFEAYTLVDLDKAITLAKRVRIAEELQDYGARLMVVRTALAEGKKLAAFRFLNDMQEDGLPPGIDHTPYHQLRAAAGGGYDYLLNAMAREPSDMLRTVLRSYGAKADKTPKEVDLDLATALRANARPAPVPVSEFRGKVVLLNFWYPLCEACRREDVYLQNAMHMFGPDRVVVLSVNVHPAEERMVAPYIRGNGFFFRPLHVETVFAGQAIPTTLVIDPEGRVVNSLPEIRGAAGERALELQVEALLAKR